jgi:hypothetical protein
MYLGFTKGLIQRPLKIYLDIALSKNELVVV